MLTLSRRISILSLFVATGFLLLFAALRVDSATIVAGDLIKGQTDTVYYYGQDRKRYVFPNLKTYLTWYPGFSTVKVISAEALAAFPLGGNVTYRPGFKLVKITTDPKVYAVAQGGVLRWVKTEEVARALYGLDWNKKVDDIPDAFFVNYTVGADIATASDLSPLTEMTTAKDINTDKKLIAMSPPPSPTPSPVPAPSPTPTPTPTPTPSPTPTPTPSPSPTPSPTTTSTTSTTTSTPTTTTSTPTPSTSTTPLPPPVESRPLKTLAEAKGIRFGAYYNSDRRSSRHDEIFEKEMKFMTIYLGWASTPGPNNDGVTPDDITLYDESVSWGQARNMEINAQSLVWFDGLELPEWFKATSTANIEGIMNRRIDTLMGRYKGKIKYWNVVNEAFDDHGKLRQGHQWAAAMGDDYIRKAFVRAHAADPSAILHYNEYDIQLEANRAKFDGVKNLLIDLKKQGTPVHALGWQMHVTPQDFHAPTFLARLNEIADLGFDNYVTELDVTIPENATATHFEQQKQTYKAVVETFLKARRPPLSPTVGPYKTLITWGIHDGDPDWLTKNHPFLFDENFNKKPAYFGVQEALK